MFKRTDNGEYVNLNWVASIEMDVKSPSYQYPYRVVAVTQRSGNINEDSFFILKEFKDQLSAQEYLDRFFDEDPSLEMRS